MFSTEIQYADFATEEVAEKNRELLLKNKKINHDSIHVFPIPAVRGVRSWRLEWRSKAKT